MSDIAVVADADRSAAPEPPAESRPTRRALPWRRIRRSVSIWLAALVLLIAVGFAFLPDLFARYDPLIGTPADKLLPPSATYWFGTDNLGRDVFSRVVHGAGLSLGSTLLAVGLAVVIGSTLGLVSGALGGVIDTVFMRFVEVLQSIPTLLASLALVTVLGFGTVNVAIAVGVTFIAAFARVMRAEVLRVRSSAYVEAATAGGSSPLRVLWRHILPNSYAPVLSLAAVQFGLAVLAVSALSFLGFGAVPPTPEWGSLVSEGRGFLGVAWWMTTMPGLTMIAIVLSAHRLGHALDDRRSR
ncbi:ABC transporter permease [Millisia brevis]|uniref:ABC transporter permease n=1 Tax=Millisia brevis TaxID=264148 RepID=UPI00082D9BBB|nr:ABC transporter permease [Millisia brevis]